ncbi:MAG: hypothetical protein HY051_00145 [Candidatus Aenigmarchaeota archaeon]|nr:hypothetical protein [Candidatus Aenigmarchaeota archaeon]
MKGITPVIALVMLMLITVGMVGIAYAWFSGLLVTQTEKGISVPPGGAYCAGGKISVLIQNNGATSNVIGADVIIAQVDGTDVPTDGDSGLDNEKMPDTATIAPGSAALVIQTWQCGGASCSSGSHIVRVGTRTGVVESTAFCK